MTGVIKYQVMSDSGAIKFQVKVSLITDNEKATMLLNLE